MGRLFWFWGWVSGWGTFKIPALRLDARPLHHASRGPASGRSISQIDLELLGAIQPGPPREGGDFGCYEQAST